MGWFHGRMFALPKSLKISAKNRIFLFVIGRLGNSLQRKVRFIGKICPSILNPLNGPISHEIGKPKRFKKLPCRCDDCLYCGRLLLKLSEGVMFSKNAAIGLQPNN